LPPQTSVFVDNWVDDEIASLEGSVTGPAEPAGAWNAQRSHRPERVRLARRPVFETGRFVVYALAVAVGSATGLLIAALLSKP
jgi:hypothetical protein